MKENLFKIGLGGYKILQAPNMTKTQMMSYLITTPNGKLIVIDGGLITGKHPGMVDQFMIAFVKEMEKI